MSLVVFFAPGLPAPGGSKRGFVIGGRAVLTEDCKRSKPWRAVVALAANEAHPGPPLAGPLSLELTFVMPRPRGHYGTGRNAGTLRASAPSYPAVKPDATKLVRAVEDALTKVVWGDDAQVVEQRACKVYGDTPGCRVVVRTMPAG